MMAALLFLACNGDDDTGGGTPPDVTGHYNVILEGVTGCESDPTWLDWCEGPLVISGEPDSLSFDFGEEVIFPGTVTSARGYSFSGSLVVDGADVSVVNAGGFSVGKNDLWEMEGDFEAIVSTDPEFKSDDCTIDGPMHAMMLDTL